MILLSIFEATLGGVIIGGISGAVGGVILGFAVGVLNLKEQNSHLRYKVELMKENREEEDDEEDDKED
jgi:hypothetical protein